MDDSTAPEQKNSVTGERPKPRYGEYAPEGWTPLAQKAASAAPQTQKETPAGQAPPHNLGIANPAQPAERAQAPAVTTPEPDTRLPAEHPQPAYGQLADTQQPTETKRRVSQNPPATEQKAQSAAKKHPVDVTATIILLAVGAFGALNFAASLFTLEQGLTSIADILDIKDFILPEWTGIAVTAGWISVLALYAINLVLSIRRMLARKLAFFVPLITAVIAFIVMVGVSTAVSLSSPELTEKMSDPASIDKILASTQKNIG